MFGTEKENTDNGIRFQRREDLIQFIELIKDVKDIKALLMENKLPEIKTKMDFLLRFFWILAIGVIGGLVTSIFGLVLKK